MSNAVKTTYFSNYKSLDLSQAEFFGLMEVRNLLAQDLPLHAIKRFERLLASRKVEARKELVIKGLEAITPLKFQDGKYFVSTKAAKVAKAEYQAFAERELERDVAYLFEQGADYLDEAEALIQSKLEAIATARSFIEAGEQPPVPETAHEELSDYQTLSI